MTLDNLPRGGRKAGDTSLSCTCEGSGLSMLPPHAYCTASNDVATASRLGRDTAPCQGCSLGHQLLGLPPCDYSRPLGRPAILAILKTPGRPLAIATKVSAQALCLQSPSDVEAKHMRADTAIQRGHGATAARLTPDQKVGISNLSGLICHTLAAMESTTARAPQQATGCVPGLMGGTRPP